ncbi:MAG: hypothetical protein A2Y38_07635 [Spirochaetes bacterium GWB1_59_5]|nr:MAG: hypothetical protein A2Y38_07635 [Spirochaetes bacterium GWB1_59_5]
MNERELLEVKEHERRSAALRGVLRSVRLARIKIVAGNATVAVVALEQAEARLRAMLGVGIRTVREGGD